MSAFRSETVKKMVEEFYELRKNNPTISIEEIAKKYSVNKKTVYRLLDEIAEKNGVTRDDLLFRPHKQHQMKSNPKVETKSAEQINPQGLIEKFDNLISDTREVADDIRSAINENRNKCTEIEEENK